MPAAASVSSNYVAQSALGASLAQQVAQAWPLLSPANLEKSTLTLAGALVPVVQQHAMASRALANEFYQHERIANGVTEPFLPVGAGLPVAQKVYQYVQWATKPARTAAPADAPALLIPARQNAASALQKLVADTGRQQIVGNVLADRRATAFAREAEPGACWFCAMLATRGAVYRSAWAAGQRSFAGADFNSYHNHCRCQVIPLFGAYTPPEHVQQWQQLWKDSTGDVHGRAKMRAFREAFNGQAN